MPENCVGFGKTKAIEWHQVWGRREGHTIEPLGHIPQTDDTEDSGPIKRSSAHTPTRIIAKTIIQQPSESPTTLAPSPIRKDNSQSPKSKSPPNCPLLPFPHLQNPHTRPRHCQDHSIPHHLRNRKPHQHPLLRYTIHLRIVPRNTHGAFKGEEDEAPEDDEGDKGVVEFAEGDIGVENAAVEEEDGEFDGSVGYFLEDDGGADDLDDFSNGVA